MAARSEKDAMEAIERLKAELDVASSSEGKGKGGGGGPEPGEVVWLKLNLSDPREAKKAAEEFLEREGRLDILGMF
jgi:NAD(P)-dependent dehydrogenase (short-subunit alcohol dehydrogenase family)